METFRPSKMCWICGSSIALEDCKVDEHGLPVHGNCYVAKLARWKKNTSPEVDQSLPPTTTGSASDESGQE
jgi:hypothetical protein